jgi:hypothetical protein
MKHSSSPDCGKVYFIQPYVIKVISDLRKIDGLSSVSAVNPHKNTKIYLGNWYKTDLILIKLYYSEQRTNRPFRRMEYSLTQHEVSHMYC